MGRNTSGRILGSSLNEKLTGRAGWLRGSTCWEVGYGSGSDDAVGAGSDGDDAADDDGNNGTILKTAICGTMVAMR